MEEQTGKSKKKSRGVGQVIERSMSADKLPFQKVREFRLIEIRKVETMWDCMWD